MELAIETLMSLIDCGAEVQQAIVTVSRIYYITPEQLISYLV